MYVRATDVADMMNISIAKAYQIIRQLNNELEAKNYLIVSGRVPRKYFMERFYN